MVKLYDKCSPSDYDMTRLSTFDKAYCFIRSEDRSKVEEGVNMFRRLLIDNPINIEEIYYNLYLGQYVLGDTKSIIKNNLNIEDKRSKRLLYAIESRKTKKLNYALATVIVVSTLLFTAFVNINIK